MAASSHLAGAAAAAVTGPLLFILTRPASPNASVAWLAAALYCANPVTIAAAWLTDGSSLVDNALLVAAIVAATRGATLLSIVLTALLAYHLPVLGGCAALPLLRVAVTSLPARKGARFLVVLDAALAAATIGVLLASWGYVSGALAPRLHLQTIDASSVLPELGLSWYLLSTAFLRYMPYFLVLVWLHPFAYVAPVLLRFWHAPSIALVIVCCLASLFDPTEAFSLARLPLCASLMLACAPAVAADVRNVKLWLGLLAFCVGVSPTMKHIWLHTASGNANFLFNQQLLFALCTGSVTAEYTAAALRVTKAARRGRPPPPPLPSGVLPPPPQLE